MAYRLISPLMHGEGIKKLQGWLSGDNPWKINFRPGLHDGVYGRGTAGAVQRAKRELGWPARKCTPAAGPTFLAIISGKKPLPRSYVLRRKVRRSSVDRGKKLRAAIVAETRLQIKIGRSESPPGSNRVMYSEWYGVIGAWCAMFVTWVVVRASKTAGIKPRYFRKGVHECYVPYVLHAAASRKYGLSVIAEPEPGDLPLYDWDQDGVPDHIGVLLEWHDADHRGFDAGEGNTAHGNDSNGGKVMLRDDRSRGQVRAFVRIGV